MLGMRLVKFPPLVRLSCAPSSPHPCGRSHYFRYDLGSALQAGVKGPGWEPGPSRFSLAFALGGACTLLLVKPKQENTSGGGVSGS